MRNPNRMPYASSPINQKRLEMIVFGEDWGAHPSSTQHLIKRLIPHHDIVWVNSLGLRRPKLTMRDTKRAATKLRAMISKPSTQQPETAPLPILNPRAVSWPGNPLAGYINGHLLRRQIDKIIAQSTMNKPLLWASMPSVIDAIDHYPDHTVIYYVGDDFGSLAGVDHTPVRKMEERLAARADLIIAASPALQARFPAHKTILVEHGVDYQLFSQDAPRAADLPDHPLIAGFYGSIHDWLDQEMIAAAARACPDWHFVFVGDVHADISALQALRNIRFLGPRAHDLLPCYAQHWQASLLPFKDCEQIRACNPLKLKEYLSAGKPIISAAFPAMQAYADKLHTIHDAHDFITALQALQIQGTTQRTPYKPMADQSWDAKAQLVEMHLRVMV